MKYGKIVIIIAIFMVLFGVYEVNAENYEESVWAQDGSSISCDSFSDELKMAYTDYKYDTQTGKFNLIGNKYSSSKNNSTIYYAVSKDRYTLMAYIPNYNKSYESGKILDSYQLPPVFCDKTSKFFKTSSVSSSVDTKPYEINEKDVSNKNNKIIYIVVSLGVVFLVIVVLVMSKRKKAI